MGRPARSQRARELVVKRADRTGPALRVTWKASGERAPATVKPGTAAAAAVRKFEQWKVAASEWDVERVAREVDGVRKQRGRAETPQVLAAAIAALARPGGHRTAGLNTVVDGYIQKWYAEIMNYIPELPAGGDEHALLTGDAAVERMAAESAAARALRAVLRNAGASGRPELARAAYQALLRRVSLVRVGEGCRAAFLAALCQAGEYTAAAAHYAALERRGVRVTAPTVAAVMPALPYLTALKLAPASKQVRAELHVHLQLMRSAARERPEGYEFCQAVWASMRADGVDVTPSHWDCLLEACLACRPDEVPHVMRRRAEADAPRTGRTFALLIAAARNRSEVEAYSLAASTDTHRAADGTVTRVPLGAVHAATMAAYARLQCADEAAALRARLAGRALLHTTAAHHRAATYHAHDTTLSDRDCRLF